MTPARRPIMSDTLACTDVRAWLSAFHDGEAMPDAQARGHIDACAACTRWEQSMSALARKAAIAPADAPDVTAAAAAAWRAQPDRRTQRQLLVGRSILAIAGVAGVVLSIVALVSGDGSAGAHLGQDVA